MTSIRSFNSPNWAFAIALQSEIYLEQKDALLALADYAGRMKVKYTLLHLAVSVLVVFLAACGSPEEEVESGDESGKGQPVAESEQEGSGEENGSNLGDELKKAGGHLKEAGKIAGEKAADAAREAGDLLGRGLERIEGATHDAKDKIVEEYGDDLEEAKRRLAEWSTLR